jgi:hypothetical protein
MPKIAPMPPTAITTALPPGTWSRAVLASAIRAPAYATSTCPATAAPLAMHAPTTTRTTQHARRPPAPLPPTAITTALLPEWWPLVVLARAVKATPPHHVLRPPAPMPPTAITTALPPGTWSRVVLARAVRASPAPLAVHAPQTTRATQHALRPPALMPPTAITTALPPGTWPRVVLAAVSWATGQPNAKRVPSCTRTTQHALRPPAPMLPTVTATRTACPAGWSLVVCAAAAFSTAAAPAVHATPDTRTTQRVLTLAVVVAVALIRSSDRTSSCVCDNHKANYGQIFVSKTPTPGASGFFTNQ